MAFVPLVPVTMNVAMQMGNTQEFQSPVVNSLAGSPINLSAWTDLNAYAIPLSPGPVNAPVAIGAVTAASSGIVTLITAVADPTGGAPGTCRLVISGKPTGGDALQTLCVGTLTVSQGA